MKAIECLKYGGSENLVLAEIEKPTPRDNEVRIKIHATSVTTSDVLIRKLNEPFRGNSRSTSICRDGA